MHANPTNPWLVLGRILTAICVAVLLFGTLSWLAADSPAQAPPKKPPEEEEEKPANKAKAKAPLRVDDDEPGAKAQRPGKASVPRRDDLAAEAKTNPSATVRQLYGELAMPHDILHYEGGQGQPHTIAPIADRFDPKNRPHHNLHIRELGKDGKLAKGFDVDGAKVRSIEPFELIAVNAVKRFVEKAPTDDPAKRVEALRAAERALTAVIGYHESAREQRQRVGEGWDEPLQQLRSQLIDVQLKTLDALAQDKNWEEALPLATQYAEAYAKHEIQARFADRMVPFIRQALDAKDEDAALERLRQVQELFPASTVYEQVSDQLQHIAQGYLDEAEKRRSAGDMAKANELISKVGKIFPRLQGYRDISAQITNSYKILNVGVRSLPQFLSPDLACTDSERQAVEMLFESLMKPMSEPERGTRYLTCLAAERPRQVPLGREFLLSREAYWSNGRPVTAADVSASFRRFEQQRDAKCLIDVHPGNDPYHLLVTLHQGYLEPLSLMTFKVMPADFAGKGGNQAVDFARDPVCSGPYRFNRAEKAGGKDMMTFVANNHYHRRRKPGMPYIQKIRFYVPTEPVADFAKPQASERLHVLIDFPTRDVKKLEADGGRSVNVYTLRNRRIYLLAVNHRNRTLSDKYVRLALSRAIDRNKILDDVFRRGITDKAKPHRPLNGPFPPDCWACNPDMKDSLSKPGAAKATLAQAQQAAAVARLRLAYPDDDPQVKDACEAIRKQVSQNCGIDIQLDAVEPHALRARVEAAPHDYELAYYRLDYPDETYNLWPLLNPKNAENGCNFLGFHPDGEFMKNLIDATLYRDLAKVSKYSYEVQSSFNEELPFIPLWQLDTHIAIHSDVKTFPEDPTGLDALRLFKDIERWNLGRN